MNPRTPYSIVILLISTIGLAKSMKNCIQLQNNTTCAYCYGGKTNPQDTCTKLPSDDPCFSYDSQYKACLWCNFYQGYVNSFNNVCIKTSKTIPNCVEPFMNKKGALVCLACKNGFPATDYSNCVSSVPNPPANCINGGRAPNGRVFCALCEDGYVSNLMTNGLCYKTPQEGCWQVNNAGDCVGCKAFEGYFAVSTGPNGIHQVCEKGA